MARAGLQAKRMAGAKTRPKVKAVAQPKLKPVSTPKSAAAKPRVASGAKPKIASAAKPRVAPAAKPRVAPTAKPKNKARPRKVPRTAARARAGATAGRAYLTGAELRREMSRWRRGDVFDRVHRAWDALKSARWSDAQLAALDGDVVPHVFIVTVEDEPARYRYRFVGSELADLHGQDYGGLYLHELRLGEVADLVSEAFDQVVASREPALFRGAFVTLFGDAVIADRLLLPLSSDGSRCDTLLGALTHSVE